MTDGTWSKYEKYVETPSRFRSLYVSVMFHISGIRARDDG